MHIKLSQICSIEKHFIFANLKLLFGVNDDDYSCVGDFDGDIWLWWYYRLKCPPGHYCTDGTKLQYQNPCPAGKYSRTIGLEREDQCLECLQGYYCPAGDRSGDQLCRPGYYCPPGTGNYKNNPCDAGYYTEEQGARSKILSVTYL